MAYVQTAIEAAEAAGEELLRRLPGAREVRYKGPRDIVTDADVAAQEAITALIAARYPEHALLGEEGPAQADVLGIRPVWIVDPLDGTSNYARRLPNFSVSVAVAESGQVLAGAIHDPLRHETFYAERGQGAFVRHGSERPEPLRVSATDDMARALVALDWPREPRRRAQALAALERVAAACHTVRSLGSAALELAYVAAGRLDAYFQLSLQPWDAAAGWLLISEAGGAVSTPGGGEWSLRPGGIAASNGTLHADFIRVLELRET